MTTKKKNIKWDQRPYQRIVSVTMSGGNGAGKIIFRKVAAANEPADAKYSLGDAIFDHAGWPTQLSQFAIGEDRTTGELISGPKEIDGNFDAELRLFMYIGGKQVERLEQRRKFFSFGRVISDGTSSE
eukprot:EW708773.1.p1 GENE.EW708773.1~~EW708773.1.p1  ORF type:complete len:128 (+),score=12.75 EW708773.1:1-384(+)